MLNVRAITRADAAACAAIVNHTIALGGTTAYEEPFTEDSFAAAYIDDVALCNVAYDGDRCVGFQGVFDVGDGLYSIGSFTDQARPAPGAGRALFAKTLADCRARGGVAILAKITSDNTGGLAYYSKMGFADWKVIPDDLTRADGTVVDRVNKRFELA